MRKCMILSNTKLFRLSLYICGCLLWSLLLMPATLLAEPDISARYLQSSGTNLIIEITIGAKPPSPVILIQHLPGDARILNAQPRYSNYNTKKNMAKWLLRNLEQGTSKVRITLDRSVPETGISAEIRFKPQGGGKMTTIQVGK